MLDARVDRLEAALVRLAEAQAQTQVELRQLTERMDQLTERVDRLAVGMDQLTERVDRLAVRMDQLTERVDQLAVRMDQLAQHVDRLTGTVGNMRGDWLEARYARKASSYFQSLLLGIRTVSGDELEQVATRAERQGRLSAAEHADITDADLVLRGERRDTGTLAYLVAEISTIVDSSDVERVVRRARLLERATQEPVLAAVAGERITPEADQSARRLGVARILDGRAAP